MHVYRKRRGNNTWHWCSNCSKYPTADYEEVKQLLRPTSGELCDECLRLHKDGRCRE